jgi:predicted naringenin-chalcone synthase
MFITGLGTATPATRYTQAQCWDALQSSKIFGELAPRSRAILKKVLSNQNGIATRYLALDPLTQAFDITPDALHARFTKHAPALATQAAQRALADAGKTAAEIDAIIIATCTGYLCPGLSSYVSERLAMRANAATVDLVGQGCGAALPNLRTAHALVESHQCKNVLCICVEVCSAAFYIDDDPGVLISACLFGDGAAAAVVSDTPQNGRRSVRWKSCGSILVPQDRDLLRFEHKNGMLRNILAPAVPELAGRHARTVFDQVTKKSELEKTDIKQWVLHAGGREVLLALQQSLSLTSNDIATSSAILREHGNLSSPFVLFVLQSALANNAPGGNWWVSSFGAGFSCHGAILEVE